MRRASDKIWNFVLPIVEKLGYEFVGASFGQAESGLTLRLYIDRDGGITVDDCAAVSGQVGAALDVEDLIPGEYCLEVSSPGVDRPLFATQDFERYTGAQIKVRMSVPQEGRRNYRGELMAVAGNKITVEVDGQAHHLEVDEIDYASLVAQI